MKVFSQIAALIILSSLQSWAISSEAKTESSAIDWAAPNSIKEHMIYKLSPIKGEQTFAPNVVLSDPNLSENFSEIYLVRSDNFEEGETFTLFVTASYTDTKWRNYNSAITSKEVELNVSTLKKIKPDCSDDMSSDKITCHYEEQLAVNIDFIEIVDSMTTSLDLILLNQNSGESDSIESNSIESDLGKNKRTDMIKIPGSYFLAIMRTIKSE